MKTWAKFCDIDKFNVKSKSLVAYVAARFFLCDKNSENLYGIEFYLAPPELDLPRVYKIESAKILDAEKQKLEICFEGIDSAETLQKLVGKSLLASTEDLDQFSESDWSEMENQLVGNDVVDAKLGKIGTVSAVGGTKFQKHLVVNADDGEVLIPYVPEIITSCTGSTINTELPDGILDIKEDLCE